MKRVSQSFYPNCIIRTLPTDKSHPHAVSQPNEKCPRDVGTSYVTVPVYKMNEKFSKRQIKDAANVYTVAQIRSLHSHCCSVLPDYRDKFEWQAVRVRVKLLSRVHAASYAAPGIEHVAA